MARPAAPRIEHGSSRTGPPDMAFL